MKNEQLWTFRKGKPLSWEMPKRDAHGEAAAGPCRAVTAAIGTTTAWPGRAKPAGHSPPWAATQGAPAGPGGGRERRLWWMGFFSCSPSHSCTAAAAWLSCAHSVPRSCHQGKTRRWWLILPTLKEQKLFPPIFLNQHSNTYWGATLLSECQIYI